MQDLAMITLELIQNSIQAKASRIDITLSLNQADQHSCLIVQDNGCGMDEATLKRFSSPFYTSRTTRQFGLGVAFFKQAVQQAQGTWSAHSSCGQGTTISGSWLSQHWDAPPLGNLGEMIILALQSHPELHVHFSFSFNSRSYDFDSKILESSLAPVSISELAILQWIEKEINTNIQHCKGGIDHEES